MGPLTRSPLTRSLEGVFERPAPPLEKVSIGAGDNLIGVQIQRNIQARRLTLRLNRKTGQPTLTVPKKIALDRIMRFLDKHQHWIRDQITKHPQALSLSEGVLIPFKGSTVPLTLTDRPPRTAFLCDNKLVIGGPKDMAPLRLESFLKDLARSEIRDAVKKYAHNLGRTPRSVSVRDTISRWGSCSARGTLNFSWRLIMAPEAVLQYVAAHEVAHLQEMNHSDRFWSLVTDLYGDWTEPRDWLKNNGDILLGVRFQ